MFGSSKAIPSSKSFGELCSRLGASELITGIAAGILHRFWLRLGKESDIPIWAACAIFLASQSLLKGPEPGIPLSQILTVANIRLYDFFGPLKEFMGVLRKDDSQGIPLDESIVEKLQFKYVSVTLVFEKYTELYHKFIKEADGGKYPKSPSKRASFAQSIFRFTWLLFLLAKSALFSEAAPLGDPPGPDLPSPSSKPSEVKSGEAGIKENVEKPPPDPGKGEGSKSLDFIPSLHLLLCCVDFLLGHVPEELKKLKFSELEGKPGTKLDTLLYICRMNHANYDQAREMQKKFYEWLSELCRSKTLTVHNASDPSGAQYLSGLLDRYLLENLKSLNTEYELLLYATGLFDERLFLEGNEQVQSPRPIQASLMTPIKATLGAHDWLVKTLTPLEDSPSPKLKLFYEGQPELLQNLLQKITTWMKPLIFEVENLYRRLLVTKLYFRIFENILVAESKLKSTKYPILLNHDLFNKSLLACCSEVVITAYRENLKFPWILRNYELTGFEFYTIIDCVINNEIGLPENIVKHLRSIEERILEEMGWEKASPIFSKLDAPQRELLKENLEKTRLTQTQGSPSKATTKKLLHKKVDIFLRRVAHLASLRINELADSLASEGTKLTLPLVHHIEYVFNYVLTQTELIQDRHIDQIMMCVLYGVCKVNGIKVTFKQIVDKYSLQPQAVSQTYRAAKLNGEEKGDIIKFYNEVFLNAVESFLNIFTLEGKGGGKENEIKPNPSNLVVLSPLKSQKSPQKIRNLLVSPGSTPLLMKKPGFYFGDVKTRVKRKLDYNFLLGGPEKAAQGIPPYPVQEVEPTAPIPLTHPPRTLEDPLLSFRPLLPLPSQPRVVPSFPATVPPHFTLDKLPPIAHKEPLEDPKLVRSPLQPIKFTTTITRQSQKLPNLSEIFQVEPRMPMVGQEKEKRENKGPAGQNENLPLTNSTTALLEPNKDVKRKLEDSTPSSGNKKPKF